MLGNKTATGAVANGAFESGAADDAMGNGRRRLRASWAAGASLTLLGLFIRRQHFAVRRQYSTRLARFAVSAVVNQRFN